MKIVKRKITELIAAEYNPRKINKVQEQDLKDSLTRFGLVDPIIININKERKNIVIGGHQRLKVWADLGNTEIDCNELDLTLDKERELNIRLNKNGGSFDDELVKEYFDYEELTEWGFTPDELFDKEETTADGLIDDDEIPEAKESKVKLGDIWKLGSHRIMCGDSTSSDDVAKLMNGEKADMVFTDPPYNIDFKDAKNRNILNDNLGDNFEQFILDIINNMLLNIEKGFIYLCFSQRFILEYTKAIKDNDLNDYEIIIWHKDTTMRMGKDYRNYYEPIWMFRLNNPIFYGKREYEKNVWEINSIHSAASKDDNGDSWFKGGAKNLTLHPTQKPVGVPTKAINNSSKINDIILDLFLGSGSTLIAAEKLNRKCFGMELDEKYCDVIIERWEQFTGLKAEKLNE